MKLGRFYRDSDGGAAIEFGITAPLFFMLVVGIMEFGLLMWTQAGLQHGVAMAARCAAVTANANQTTFCGSASIPDYAAQQTFGLNPLSSVFTVSAPTKCVDQVSGNQIDGYQVSANYPFTFISTYFGMPSLTINAQSCFPK
jgi:Flp pilus assembly protein TadG